MAPCLEHGRLITSPVSRWLFAVDSTPKDVEEAASPPFSRREMTGFKDSRQRIRVTNWWKSRLGFHPDPFVDRKRIESMAKRSQKAQQDELDFAIGLPGQSDGEAITARRAGGMSDLEMCVSPVIEKPQLALREHGQGIEPGLKG